MRPCTKQPIVPVLASPTRQSSDFLPARLDRLLTSPRPMDGEVILAPTVGAEFFGTTLPAGWTVLPYGGGSPKRNCERRQGERGDGAAASGWTVWAGPRLGVCRHLYRRPLPGWRAWDIALMAAMGMSGRHLIRRVWAPRSTPIRMVQYFDPRLMAEFTPSLPHRVDIYRRRILYRRSPEETASWSHLREICGPCSLTTSPMRICSRSTGCA